MPIFRTKVDASLTSKIYNIVAVLVDEKANVNSWGITIRRLFNIGDKEVLKITLQEKHDYNDLPIWESKLIWQYDHRFATYDRCSPNEKENGNPKEVDNYSKINFNYSILPRRWISYEKSISGQGTWLEKYKCLIGFRDITNSTNERTIIASIIPICAPDFTLRILYAKEYRYAYLLLANLNTLVLDYIARQKIGGMHLSDYITKQLPFLSLESYANDDMKFIATRILELTYTAWDLKPFAEDMGYEGQPFKWDEERRPLLRAELDAYYAKLYGLNRDELRYILDPQDVYGPNFPGETFRVLKEKEIRQYGEYRTRRLVLEAWDRLFGEK